MKRSVNPITTKASKALKAKLLAKQGKTLLEIARELYTTTNEVLDLLRYENI